MADWEEEMQRPAMPLIREQLVAHFPLEPTRRYQSGFPIVSTCVFANKTRNPQESHKSYEELEWIIKWTTHTEQNGGLCGRATMTFSGMGDNAYKIMTTLTETGQSEQNRPDDSIIIDKDHCHIIFPYTLHAATVRPFEAQLGFVPDITLTITVHEIQKIDAYQVTGQRWPSGSKWEFYKDVFDVLVNTSLLQAAHKKLEKFKMDVQQRVVSVKEASAFYDVLCLLCHRAFDGQDKYHEVMLNVFKMGFTEGWMEMDNPDTLLDFYTRTMLPNYSLLNDEKPYEQVLRIGEAILGNCQIIKLKLNPNVTYLRSQTEPIEQMGENKGQFTFFLEQSRHGTLLLAAMNFQVELRHQARMKITLLENGTVANTQTTYRIVDTNQKTIKMIVSVLSGKQIQQMIDGNLSLNIQIHMQSTMCNFIHNYQYDENGISVYIMPGPVNAWLVCEDEKKIGVCKEHVSNHSPLLEQLFYNTDFVDCGENFVEIKANSEVVLDVLNIIYHRCHSVPLDRLQDVLALAGYLLAPVVTRYLEMAILTTELISVEDKYIMRHPEYHDTFKFELNEEQIQALVASKHDNELDCGANGRVA